LSKFQDSATRSLDVAPKKTLVPLSKELSPGSLKEVAESLFKTDKEIRKQQATGSKIAAETDNQIMGGFFRIIPSSIVGSKADVKIEDKEEFPPLGDTDEAEMILDWDDFEPALKPFSFSEILRKKAVREIIAKHSEIPEKVVDVAEPEGPTINDWFEERLKSDAPGTKGSEAVGSNSPVAELNQQKNGTKTMEAKSQDSETDWFSFQSEDEFQMSNVPKETLPEAQPEQSARPRPSDSWKMKRYTQTLSILKDPCNNVIARQDSLGLNQISEISDLLESEASGDTPEVMPEMESTKSGGTSESKKPSWWRIPSPPMEKDVSKSEECLQIADITNSANVTKVEKNEGEKENVKKPMEKNLSSDSKTAKAVSKNVAGDSKSRDDAESVVDWMLKGSSMLKESAGALKERPTPPRDSPVAEIAELETRSSTPDCWSDLSGSEVDDPPVMFEPKLDPHQDENRPKIDKSAVKSVVGGRMKGEENGESATVEKKEISGKRDNFNFKGSRRTTSGTNTAKADRYMYVTDKMPSDSHNWRESTVDNSSSKLWVNQTQLGMTTSSASKTAEKIGTKNSRESPFEYDYSYLPDLEEPKNPEVVETATYVDDEKEEDQVEICDKKFAFQLWDKLSDSDEEVTVIMEDIIQDRQMEEKERRRKIHEKYVRVAPEDNSFKGFGLMKPRCCNCGDENHRTYSCPNFK
jgi:hypothetical protein